MKAPLIPHLTAPGGGAPLRLATVSEQRGDEILTGTVLSERQGIFPVRGGILDLLSYSYGQLSLAQSTNLFYPVARYYERPWRVNSLSLLSGQSLPFAREREILFEMLGEPEGALWLDLAASSGLYSRWLAPRLAPDASVICLDLSLQMLLRAQAAARAEQHDTIAFVAARAEQLPFADGALDGALCGGSLNEFGSEAVNPVLRELYRVLKPGGRALFMHLLTAQSARGRMLQAMVTRPGGIAFWSRPESNALFEGAGFTIEQERTFGTVAFTALRKLD